MKRWFKRVAIAATTAVVLAFSGVGWYAFSTPPAHHLPLAHDLIDANSVQGAQMLARSAEKSDYEQLAPEFVSQSRRGYCGVASAVTVINAALHAHSRFNQRSLFTPDTTAVRSEFAVTFGGMTLDQLGGIFKAHHLQARVVHATQSNLPSFRDLVRGTLAEPQFFLIVNYDRASLGQEGPGHISPLGAYDAETDRVLVMDVASYKYPYTWVPLPMLWRAMNTIDSDSRQSRGYVLVGADMAKM